MLASAPGHDLWALWHLGRACMHGRSFYWVLGGHRLKPSLVSSLFSLSSHQMLQRHSFSHRQGRGGQRPVIQSLLRV